MIEVDRDEKINIFANLKGGVLLCYSFSFVNPTRLHSVGNLLVATLNCSNYWLCGKIDAVAGFLQPILIMSAPERVYVGHIWALQVQSPGLESVLADQRPK